jgi:hypothetical protein
VAADRAQLEAWIAATHRTQQRLRTALIPAGAVALALLLWSRLVGVGACALVGLVALFGFWITSGHITEWEQQIAALDKPRHVGPVTRREPD